MFHHRWWPLLGCMAVLLATSAAPTAVYRVQTDKGELVITSDNPDIEVLVRQNGKMVRIIDTKTNKEVNLDAGMYELALKGQAEGLKLSVEKATIRRGDTVLATVTYNGKAPVELPPAKPEVLNSIEWQDAEQGFPAHIFQTGISGDGKLFFGAGDGGPSGSIRIFEMATGKLIQEFRPGTDVWYSHAAFVPGGKYLAAGYKDDKDLYLWDIATAKVVRKFTGHTEPGNGVAVSPDGKRILSWGQDATVRLWDLDTGKELKKLEGHTDKAAGVFSLDSKKVLTFSPDKTLRLWDVETGKELKKLEGHEDAVSGALSPDGKRALSWSPDKTIRLWDLDSGKEIRRFDEPRTRSNPLVSWPMGARWSLASIRHIVCGKPRAASSCAKSISPRWAGTAAP